MALSDNTSLKRLNAFLTSSQLAFKNLICYQLFCSQFLWQAKTILIATRKKGCTKAHMKYTKATKWHSFYRNLASPIYILNIVHNIHPSKSRTAIKTEVHQTSPRPTSPGCKWSAKQFRISSYKGQNGVSVDFYQYAYKPLPSFNLET